MNNKLPIHYNPSSRILRPLSLGTLMSEESPIMKRYKFFPIPRHLIRRQELVHDPSKKTNRKGMSFSGDFEGGNLGFVWKIAPMTYEIRMMPDPCNYYSASWFFFKVSNIAPGEYTFIISGFYRDAQLHKFGVQPTALSLNGTNRGEGWKRIGKNLNFWCSKSTPQCHEYSFSFSFNVVQKDTMYFSYLYPYNYSDLKRHFKAKNYPFTPICISEGGLDVPAVLWDADEQKFCKPVPQVSTRWPSTKKKPLILIAARLHPGETNSSYAMEAFIDKLFSGSPHTKELLSLFSFLILPLMNPDGVVCGFFRTQLNGCDMNRIWRDPNMIEHRKAYYVTKLVDNLVQTRPLLFMLDFHGHTAQCNAFTYGVQNSEALMNEYEGLFPQIFNNLCDIFDSRESLSLSSDEFSSTMRVSFHHRYKVPFAYTLEMSFGGCNIGNSSYTQLTENSYRLIGATTVDAIYQMLCIFCPISSIIEAYTPPILD